MLAFGTSFGLAKVGFERPILVSSGFGFGCDFVLLDCLVEFGDPEDLVIVNVSFRAEVDDVLEVDELELVLFLRHELKPGAFSPL